MYISYKVQYEKWTPLNIILTFPNSPLSSDSAMQTKPNLETFPGKKSVPGCGDYINGYLQLM